MTRISSSTGAVIRRRAHWRLAALLSCVGLVVALFSTSGLAQQGPLMLQWVEPTSLEPDVAEGLFTAYDAGRYADFERLAGTSASALINPFEFEAEAERWMDAAPDRRRAAFVAAAVALELAALPRPGLLLTRMTRAVAIDRASVLREHTLIEARFVLAELGCTWLRDHPPSGAELAWHEAFVAVARITGRQGYAIPVPPPMPGLARLAGAREAEIRREIATAETDRRDREHRWRNARETLLEQFERHAARRSPSTRIDLLSRFRGSHGQHLLARWFVGVL